MTTVLISGANRGIGLELARQYAADGAEVIAGVRDPGVADTLKAIQGVEIHAIDVGQDDGVQAFQRAVGDRPIDVLIANAGVFGAHQSIGKLDFDDWLHTYSVNSLGPVRLAQAFLPNLRAGSGKTAVAITSTLGSTSAHAGDMLAYRASKAALNNAWAGLAAALKGERLSFLLLHPGWVKTDMGGPGAQITSEQSADGLRARIAEASLVQSGKLFAYDGKPLPW